LTYSREGVGCMGVCIVHCVGSDGLDEVDTLCNKEFSHRCVSLKGLDLLLDVWSRGEIWK
jgi:hypothetical protein